MVGTMCSTTTHTDTVTDTATGGERGEEGERGEGGGPAHTKSISSASAPEPEGLLRLKARLILWPIVLTPARSREPNGVVCREAEDEDEVETEEKEEDDTQGEGERAGERGGEEREGREAVEPEPEEAEAEVENKVKGMMVMMMMMKVFVRWIVRGESVRVRERVWAKCEEQVGVKIQPGGDLALLI